MEQILNSPYMGIILSIVAYKIGIEVNRKLKTPLANPLLIAICIIIGVLQLGGIPLESYEKGGSIIGLFLAPATTVLAVSIYKQLKLLKKYWLPIVVGAFAGSLTSVVSIIALTKVFGLDMQLSASLVPKSVTTPIAIEISSQLGGIPPITVAAVVITGIMGAVFSPLLIKLFKVKHPIAKGVAIGTSSHALGTTKAIEIGEVEGAMSGIAIGVAGILTVVITMFLA
ncbi:MAG: LrgB family protein [Cellulosilyticaceae bacterium]